MKKLTLIPVGGLANRMRTIASGITLAKQTNSLLTIVWFRDWALNAPFKTLFKPIDNSFIRLKEATTMDYLLIDRPRKKNFYIPKIYQKINFESCLYEKTITPLFKSGFDFCEWINNHKNCYMASYTAFFKYEQDIINQIFKPTDEVEQITNNLLKGMPNYKIGIHIRRTDNIDSIMNSPIELFYEAIETEIGNRTKDGIGIYLATDSEEVKNTMKERYGNYLYYSNSVADRGSIRGIQEGLAEMYALSQTNNIYGSFGSSYSEMAAQLGNKKIFQLKI